MEENSISDKNLAFINILHLRFSSNEREHHHFWKGYLINFFVNWMISSPNTRTGHSFGANKNSWPRTINVAKMEKKKKVSSNKVLRINVHRNSKNNANQNLFSLKRIPKTRKMWPGISSLNERVRKKVLKETSPLTSRLHLMYIHLNMKILSKFLSYKLHGISSRGHDTLLLLINDFSLSHNMSLSLLPKMLMDDLSENKEYLSRGTIAFTLQLIQIPEDRNSYLIPQRQDLFIEQLANYWYQDFITLSSELTKTISGHLISRDHTSDWMDIPIILDHHSPTKSQMLSSSSPSMIEEMLDDLLIRPNENDILKIDSIPRPHDKKPKISFQIIGRNLINSSGSLEKLAFRNGLLRTLLETSSEEEWIRILQSEPILENLEEIERFLLKCFECRDDPRDGEDHILKFIFKLLKRLQADFIIRDEKAESFLSLRVKIGPKGIEKLNLSGIPLGNELDELIEEHLSDSDLKISMESLTVLLLENCSLETIPKLLSFCPNLSILNLSNNKIQKLPEHLPTLEHLEMLDLGNNEIDSLPDKFVESFPNLQILNLKNNGLETLIDSIGTVCKLKELDLSNNRLKRLPDSLFTLVNLEHLFLTNNLLTALPTSIDNLNSLLVLDLGSNQLKTLPEQVGELMGLKELHLDKNYLSTIPSSIGGLKKLEYLDLGDNQLVSLPHEIGNLDSLEELYLDGNSLQELPKSLIKLKSLKILSVVDNPLEIDWNLIMNLPKLALFWF